MAGVEESESLRASLGPRAVLEDFDLICDGPTVDVEEEATDSAALATDAVRLREPRVVVVAVDVGRVVEEDAVREEEAAADEASDGALGSLLFVRLRLEPGSKGMVTRRSQRVAGDDVDYRVQREGIKGVEDICCGIGVLRQGPSC